MIERKKTHLRRQCLLRHFHPLGSATVVVVVMVVVVAANQW